MLKFLFRLAVLAIIAGGAGFWFLTMPHPLTVADLPAHQPDLVNGELMFNVGGCASCHAVKGAKDAERLKLGGGLAIKTDFGTFNVPNISPDKATGIGGWSTLDFVNAVTRGLSPEGEHLYPALPYSSYARMKLEDVIDLKGYLDTLPPVTNEVAENDLKFPFNISRGIGLWKFLYLKPGPVVTLAADASDLVKRGQYLVEGPGHCGECHTKRDFMGGPDYAHWLAGGPNPDGKGGIPNLTSGDNGIADWTEADIVSGLEMGMTPDGDFFGGSMVEVQENMARIPASDREAIAAYLKALPKLASTAPQTKP